MKIEHIVWKDCANSDKRQVGLLDIEVVWHGGRTEQFIAQGYYYPENGGQFSNNCGFTIDTKQLGVAAVTCVRSGRIVP